MRIPFTCRAAVVASISLSSTATMAFAPTIHHSLSSLQGQINSNNNSHNQVPLMTLQMSDIPRENNENNNSQQQQVSSSNALFLDKDFWSRYWKPPPPPEDTFVLLGDVLSLCVYGITDHFFCQVVSKMMVQETIQDPLHHLSKAAVSSNGGEALLQAPVWLDLNANYANSVLESNLASQLVTHYSPLLEPMGTATCLLIGSWLFAGWLHQAFAFRNTLDCKTERALTVTAKTWLTSCALLFGMVLASQAACGCDHFYLVQSGDLHYIVDSASVLVMWRYLASFVLGSGRD